MNELLFFTPRAPFLPSFLLIFAPLPSGILFSVALLLSIPTSMLATTSTFSSFFHTQKSRKRRRNLEYSMELGYERKRKKAMSVASRRHQISNYNGTASCENGRGELGAFLIFEALRFGIVRTETKKRGGNELHKDYGRCSLRLFLESDFIQQRAERVQNKIRFERNRKSVVTLNSGKSWD